MGSRPVGYLPSLAAMRLWAKMAATLALAAIGGGGSTLAVAAHPVVAHSAFAQECADPYPASRDTGNPLMLAKRPPAGDPLAGARLFVNGPRHGAAAGAIARLLGIDSGTPEGQPLPSFSDSDSWAAFARTVARRLPHLSTDAARDVRLLEKIASQPETQRISRYSAGGAPAGIFAQTQKLFCHNFTADPGAIPVITTYFLHAQLGSCPTAGQISAYAPTFEAQIDALAAATAHRPVVFLLELDAVGSSACIAHDGGLGQWESLLRFEATTLGGLPHAVAYMEGGYSDANNASYAARILNASGIRRVQGFFTNDTHENWTIDEIRYGERISRLTHGAHFIVNTSENGRGPKRNSTRAHGNNDLCNPPGRGLGPRPTTHTGFRGLDALLWTHPPGNSGGTCNGGPPSGVFWPARAIGLAARANGRLGPRYPSRPY
jgi:endoglucanase